MHPFNIKSNNGMKSIISTLLLLLLLSCKEKEGEYICTPCDLSCDTLTFLAAGTCPHCHMPLIKKSDLVQENELEIGSIAIKEGSGVFLVEGGPGKENKSIKVYYHRPKNFNSTSKILLVIPGAGRNGDSYRDAWIEESEEYSVLILSPMYAEEDYQFEDYHLCGLMYDLNLGNAIQRIEGTNIAALNEAEFDYKVNANREEWIFGDFDRIFDLTVKALHSKQTTYDVFGHSAGGQILHRFALFQPNSKADRIIASNSGFYTLPDFETALPFGIKNAPINQQDVNTSFSKKLVLFIGELDNENETGGTLLRSTTVDKQGLHRLERAGFFYQQAKALAAENESNLNWELKIIPAVGHNHRKMGDAAAKYLYINNE